MDNQIKQLQQYIDNSKNTLAITGAGISMAAGIKDMQHMNITEVVRMMSETVLKATPGISKAI